MGQRAARDVDGVRERQRVGIARARQRAERRLMHERANGCVRDQQAPHFLPHQLRRLAAQHAPCAAQMRLQFVERGLHFPALLIERCEFGGRRPRRFEHGRHEPIRQREVPTRTAPSGPALPGPPGRARRQRMRIATATLPLLLGPVGLRAPVNVQRMVVTSRS